MLGVLQQRIKAPEEVNTFMFEKEIRPKHHIKLVFEMSYEDDDLLDQLPLHINRNRVARRQASAQ